MSNAKCIAIELILPNVALRMLPDTLILGICSCSDGESFILLAMSNNL